MSEIELPVGSEAVAIHPEPGDVLVITCPGRLDMCQAHELYEMTKAHFPDHQVMVLAEGTRIEISKEPSDG